MMLQGLYTPWCFPYGMDGFQPHSMDYFLAGNPAIFSFHTPYGFHEISNEFTLQIHVLFHMDSMEESTSNYVENPLNVLSKIVSTLRIEHSAP